MTCSIFTELLPQIAKIKSSGVQNFTKASRKSLLQICSTKRRRQQIQFGRRDQIGNEGKHQNKPKKSSLSKVAANPNKLSTSRRILRYIASKTKNDMDTNTDDKDKLSVPKGINKRFYDSTHKKVG